MVFLTLLSRLLHNYTLRPNAQAILQASLKIIAFDFGLRRATFWPEAYNRLPLGIEPFGLRHTIV